MASAGPMPGPGMQPSPEQIAQMRAMMQAEASRRGLTVEQFQEQQKKAIEEEAARQGLSVPEFINKARAEAFAQQQQQMAAQQKAMAEAQARGQLPPNVQGQPAQPGQPGQPQPQQQGQQQVQQQQQVPIQPGAPNPQAVALAQWLQGQDLKPRTCILNGQRKEMFRVKRALRAIESEAYTKASNKKGSALPKVTAEKPVAEVFKLLPLSLLALRVTKIDPHEGHGHAPPKKAKGTKGLWTVKIEGQQDIQPDLHYVWLHEGPQWKQKAMALGAVLCVFAVVLFPLWPYQLRIGVWYLSMFALGLIGLFFVMAIFRLILFIITMFAVPPGLWLYPNLFEDVGFFDSFRPVWAWHEDPKAVKAAKKQKRADKKAKLAAKAGDGEAATPSAGATTVQPAEATSAESQPVDSAPSATGTETAKGATQRVMSATVEEGDDSD